jgi:hypothetical protein
MTGTHIIVPALLYVGFNRGPQTHHGWAIRCRPPASAGGTHAAMNAADHEREERERSRG